MPIRKPVLAIVFFCEKWEKSGKWKKACNELEAKWWGFLLKAFFLISLIKNTKLSHESLNLLFKLLSDCFSHFFDNIFLWLDLVFGNLLLGFPWVFVLNWELSSSYSQKLLSVSSFGREFVGDWTDWSRFLVFCLP